MLGTRGLCGEVNHERTGAGNRPEMAEKERTSEVGICSGLGFQIATGGGDSQIRVPKWSSGPGGSTAR